MIFKNPAYNGWILNNVVGILWFRGSCTYLFKDHSGERNADVVALIPVY